MYSYADRLRAVELYIRLGKRLNATISPAGISHQECAEGLVPRVPTASRPAYSAGSASAKIFTGSEAGGT